MSRSTFSPNSLVGKIMMRKLLTKLISYQRRWSLVSSWGCTDILKCQTTLCCLSPLIIIWIGNVYVIFICSREIYRSFIVTAITSEYWTISSLIHKFLPHFPICLCISHAFFEAWFDVQ